MTAERRASQLEIRAKGRKLEGMAALFNTEARIGSFTETIAPGAFTRSLANGHDILALVDHDPTRVLARKRSRSLRLSEDPKGLAFDLDLPSTTAANDILALVERGDAGGMSFGFSVPADGDEWTHGGERRVLKSVDLHEISIVAAWPAYPDTMVIARSRPVIGWRLALAQRWLEAAR